MKKILCLCLVLCMATTFLCSCAPEQNIDDRGCVTVDGGSLIPENAGSITVSYADYSMGASTPERKFYEADRDQFRQFCDLLKGAEILRMTDNDALLFSGIANKDAAYISVSFDTGKALYIYDDGGISRFAGDGSAGSQHTEYYYVSPDIICYLRKIFIPDFEKDYKALSMEVDFVRADDVNSDKIDEIPFFMTRWHQTFPLSDGIIIFNIVCDSGSVDTYLRAVKYDKRGNFLWVQNYTDIKSSYYGLSGCIQTKDGSFIFSVIGDVLWGAVSSEAHLYEAETSPGWLVKCGRDGNIIWKEQIGYKSYGQVEQIFETADGGILTAGSCPEDDNFYLKNQENTAYGRTDLLLMKYDKDGNCVKLKKYGGTDYDSFGDACYSPDIGMVVCGSTQSCDGDIVQRKEKGTMLNSCEFLAVFDDNLNEKWQYVFDDQDKQEKIYTSRAAVSSKRIYVTGLLSGRSRQASVFKFNENGGIVKSAIIDIMAVTDICVTGDNTVLISEYPPTYEPASPVSRIYRLDEDLNIKGTISDAAGNGFNYSVIPMDDNGFSTVWAQIVKYLPQPLAVSHTSSDCATVLSRYDEDGKLIYRKTYDKNHDTEDYDVVVPLPDGRVITGR